ncbi:MAG: RecQ family ATP-dependent DNA helicase [Bacteroidia bacterium]|nr:RecQ family ATP-dependent DNA helicase [Bacteroidia bacterium]
MPILFLDLEIDPVIRELGYIHGGEEHRGHDLEIDPASGRIRELGYIHGGEEYRGHDLNKLLALAGQVELMAGHNLIDHDLIALLKAPGGEVYADIPTIDTLRLSPLLQPDRRSHRLDKDYQLMLGDQNNPLADARLCRELLTNLWQLFTDLSQVRQSIFRELLAGQPGLEGFFQALQFPKQDEISPDTLSELIIQGFGDLICIHAPLAEMVIHHPVELAYVLGITTTERAAIVTPSWLTHQYPQVHRIFGLLRGRNCGQPDCPWCADKLDPHRNLMRYFRYAGFRKFEGDGDIPLQEQAVQLALADESLLAIFPTGGGKSLTFQLPALIRGQVTGALTVVISPLVALMKDQIDVLWERSIVNAAAINGLLSPPERAEVLEKVDDGTVSLLYLAPESLRSRTILRLLTRRPIDRFVIDEAHCFSTWGHDFRVDYLYIAEFMRQLQEAKGNPEKIPVSCFTATARPEVIEDICRYFAEKSGLELKVFQTYQGRQNLKFQALSTAEEGSKFTRLLAHLNERKGPVIIYVSRTRQTEKVANSLRKAGIDAEYFHGRMQPREKREVLDRFKKGETEVIVATSAFGMGVDKDNVAMVIHYEISNSLENYVQEAGRAGRDKDKVPEAKCVILYDEEDLNKHFALLQGAKLNKKEIAQIWQAIKGFRQRRISKSALQIARAAGWDEDMRDLKTRVTTAINALEDSGFIKRTYNSPVIFADALIPPDFESAARKVRENAARFTEKQREAAFRILQYLFSARANPENAGAEVDVMANALGIPLPEVSETVNLLKDCGVLNDFMDLTALVDISQARENSKKVFSEFNKLEPLFLEWLHPDQTENPQNFDLREANDSLLDQGLKSNISMLRKLMTYWEWRGYLKKERVEFGEMIYRVRFKKDKEIILEEIKERLDWAGRILDHLLELGRNPKTKSESGANEVEFSVIGLKKALEFGDMLQRQATTTQYQQYLLFLQSVGAIDIIRGFMVFYNRLNILREEMNNRRGYGEKDHEKLANHYEKKTEQIHIVGEYASRLLRSQIEALIFTDDYFKLDYDEFLKKYFSGKRGMIKRPLTEAKFQAIFGQLSEEQLEPVKDKAHEQILVAAGPGSGKTRVLVHKMASLLLMEDIKPEQFLMLAFSRPAAQEFKSRIRELVPGLSNHLDIHTYHGFAFRLIGKKGDLLKSENIVQNATQAIREGEVPIEKVAAKSVLMLDEFQDISETEWEFIQAIGEKASDFRIIAAGDDDQSIYEFRGASVEYMRKLVAKEKSQTYFLTRNYRSKENIVQFANQFLKLLPDGSRIKASQPLVAKDQSHGTLRLNRYTRGHLFEPLVKAVLAHPREGSTAVLTATNEEAHLLTHLLRQAGLPAQLVASRQGFALRNLAEIREFTREILQAARLELGFIDHQTWKTARENLEQRYKSSRNLNLVQRILDQFETQFPKKFRADWLECLDGLRNEDFFFPDQDKLLVSTMHKAKGKEFDNVFILLDNFNLSEDEKKRVVYVAVTRAKSHLEIHTNQAYFDQIRVPDLQIRDSEGTPDLPSEIILPMTLEDVNLNFYKKGYVQNHLDFVRAGDTLNFQTAPYEHLTHPSQDMRVGEFSRKFQATLQDHQQKGYHITQFTAANLVWWFDAKDTQQEYLVLLSEAHLKRG